LLLFPANLMGVTKLRAFRSKYRASELFRLPSRWVGAKTMKPDPHRPQWRLIQEALAVGALVGLAHAICEISLLACYGLEFTVLDASLIALLSLAAAAATGALAGIGTLVLMKGRTADGPSQLRMAVWTVVTGVYALAFLAIVSQHPGALGTATALLLTMPVAVAAFFLVLRSGGKPAVIFWASMAVASTLCVVQLIHGGLWMIPPSNRSGFVTLLVAGTVLCYMVLGWSSRMSRRQPAAGSAPRFAAVTLGAGMLWIGVVPWGSSSGSGWLVYDAGKPAVSAASVPNIVLIVLDTVRADHLDLFGYSRETMPNLRRFAEQDCQAVNRTFTTSSWTLPSHASMFTGLYPSTHGAHTPFVHEDEPELYAHPMRDDVTTLAEFLGQRGYQTGVVAANYGALRDLGLLRGFAHQDVVSGASQLAATVSWSDRLQIDGLPSPGTLLRTMLPASLASRASLFNRREPPYRRAREITDRAQRWLRGHSDQPFFLFLNYLDAHQPYLPPPQDDERFAARPNGEEWRDFPTERFNACRRQQGGFTKPEADFLIGQYDAELVAMDRELARLLDYLKHSGRFDDTMILVATDHGEAFFEHGFLEHGNALHQPEIDGFLLIKMPSSSGPIYPSPMMQSVDLLPTIASVLREPVPPDVEGSPWGNGRDYALSELFCRTCGAGRDEGQWPESFRREQVAVIVQDWKLIRSTNAADKRTDEIYNLRDDPAELHPVPHLPPDKASRFEQVLTERSRRLGDRLTRKGTDDKKLIERLRSLGYVQ
jgi:arylsulfatase A-like enzyme